MCDAHYRCILTLSHSWFFKQTALDLPKLLRAVTLPIAPETSLCCFLLNLDFVSMNNSCLILFILFCNEG